jgi:hypothetical protein
MEHTSFDSPILGEDTEIEDNDNMNNDNPFKELKNLISRQDIDVKSLLTDKQIVINHKLNMLQKLYEMDGSKSSTECATMLKYFTNRYMTLVINKDGMSRKQFIEALHKGEDKAQQARQLKLQNGVLQL